MNNGPFSRAWWFEHWWFPLLLVLIPIGTGIYLAGRGDADGPPKIRNVADEAAARSFLWSGKADKFESPPLNDILSDQIADFDPPAFSADGVGGDIQVYTPKRVVEEASELQGQSIVVAGRFVEGKAQESKFGVEGVARIRGREPGFDLYVGLPFFSSDSFKVGVPVWGIVHVVAAGRTSPAGGGMRQSAYVVTDHTGSLNPNGDPGSRALRKALLDVQKP